MDIWICLRKIRNENIRQCIIFSYYGGSLKDEIRAMQVQAMKTIMIGDRMNRRVKASEMIVFDEMTRGYGNDESE